jgi:nucleoside-diphosphate-sugar epimerase
VEYDAKIYVAGSSGLVGSAIIRKLRGDGYTQIIERTSREVDLRNQVAVDKLFRTEQPQYVFLAAAKVGGICANERLPALLRKFYEAKQAGSSTVTVWGSGAPRREFLYVDDLAEACCFLMNEYNAGEIINIGTGRDVTIDELAMLIADAVGFTGNIVYDTSKPDGTPVKCLDVSKINRLGWYAQTSLQEGIKKTLDWYSQSSV